MVGSALRSKALQSAYQGASGRILDHIFRGLSADARSAGDPLLIRLGKGTMALLSEGEDRTSIPLERNIPEESPAAEATVLGIVRDVFSRASAKPFDLAAHLELVNDKLMKVSKAVLRDPTRKLVVDIYEKASDSMKSKGTETFVLSHDTLDLLTILHRTGIDLVMNSQEADRRIKGLERQSVNRILMVAPGAFEGNVDAAQDNAFMEVNYTPAGESLQEVVLKEFEGLYSELVERAGISVSVFSHSSSHNTPDAVFPNNWFSTHNGKTLCLYPMKVSNRQNERRTDMISYIWGIGYKTIEDFTDSEKQTPPRILEGTGSLVLDHIHKVAYVAESERSDLVLAQDWCEKMDFELVGFPCCDENGKPVYHTNVIMAIGSSVAILCSDSIPDKDARQKVVKSLERGGREVIEITFAQMGQMCGNAIELLNDKGLPVMVMSSQAYHGFTPEQRSRILEHVAAIHHAPIPTIERIGGGSVRCTIAELR